MLQASVAHGKKALEASNLRKQQAVRQLRDEAAQKQLQYMWGAIDAEKYAPTKRRVPVLAVLAVQAVLPLLPLLPLLPVLADKRTL